MVVTGVVEESMIAAQVAREIGVSLDRVRAAIQLFDEGNTIPFVARYRKEMTGELDEVALRRIAERLEYIRGLNVRKAETTRLIAEQGSLTEELEQAIRAANNLAEVDDLYRPFRPKRKTRASVAREKGLLGLAESLLSGNIIDCEAEATRYLSEEHGVLLVEDALAGACDIIAELVADDAVARKWIREKTWQKGQLVSRSADEQAESVYQMYYDYREPICSVPPHRVLAMNRGEREDVLKLRIEAPIDDALVYLKKKWRKAKGAVNDYIERAVIDAYHRLIEQAIERELRNQLTEVAEEQAIRVFATNLRQLLLQPPVRGRVVLGVDPAYRTGCKLAVVDDTGKLLRVAVVYPTPPLSKQTQARHLITEFVAQYGVTLIAIGNGTASRETEQFIAETIPVLPHAIEYVIVSEAGASVYSASELAGEEFPDLDVSERSAISIARRLQDPLAELVKIDPKAVGVGQYQHDVSQKRLGESLAGVVESAVNSVGVDVNTASPALLSHVAGLSGAVAKQIVRYREENGRFQNRTQLKKVPRLGPKAFEQCAGFLRVPGGTVFLDNTPIHPESYAAAEMLLRELGVDSPGMSSKTARKKSEQSAVDGGLIDALKDVLQDSRVLEMAAAIGVGEPTLRDMIDALLRPGRDPREDLPAPIFRTDVLKMEDLQVEMILQGTVRNVVDFGAFVDIGVKQDGLVHVSEMADRFVRRPLDFVHVGDVVTVRVIGLDAAKGRVSLSMKGMQK